MVTPSLSARGRCESDIGHILYDPRGGPASSAVCREAKASPRRMATETETLAADTHSTAAVPRSTTGSVYP
jgi:hypothetical protein